MTTLEAIMEIENNEKITEERYIECFQFLINNDIVWSLQGWYGRTAKYLIENGLCKRRQ